MDKPSSKSTLKTSKSQGKGKHSLLLGGLVVLLIAITPFLFYSYKSFPSNTQLWETPLWSVETSFNSINTFFWLFTSKAVPIFLLLLWFFTCKHWWHWIILVPITMYIFQLWGIINQSNNVDEVEIYYMLPVMMIVIPAVYLIRAKLFNKIRGDDLKSFEEDLLEKKSPWDQLKELFG